MKAKLQLISFLTVAFQPEMRAAMPSGFKRLIFQFPLDKPREELAFSQAGLS